MAYPVALHLTPQLTGRNRLTCALRPILSIPHIILVGPLVFFYRSGGVGLIGAAAYVLAVVGWFLLLTRDTHPAGIRDFARYYMRWRTRGLAYMALLVDEYPPFGDAPHPASIEIADPGAPRDRAAIALRLLLVVPHLVVLAFLFLAWLLVTVVAWFAILFTGAYPSGLARFSLDAMAWTLRVEAYLLLLVDDYPPFTLEGSEQAPRGEVPPPVPV